jgi:hypothetical protein
MSGRRVTIPLPEGGAVMQNQELRKLLEKLQEEIEGTQTIDERGLALLRELDADIQALLARAGNTQIQSELSLRKRLEEAIDHLEITHPTLTMGLSDMLAILSNAGI